LSARLCLAILLALLPVSAHAATPKPVKSKPPVLTCKTAGADGLTYTVIKAGKGGQPGADAKVTVNYKGMLKSDGTQFDAGEGAQFKVGGVIPGFAQGLQLMQPGGKYRLCIPAALGYGESGTGPIPPNADLVFEVDLISFTTPPPKPVVPVAERSCAQTTASGLGYAMIKPGSGATATDADVVLIDYAMFNPATGIIAQKQLWEKVPLSQATSLFGEALKMMPPGSSYRFCLPPALAETPNPDEERVNLIVDMIAVRPAPAVEE
jgi:FKBP-type peptidyl-prolyl cis-trans isomerase